MGYQPCHKGDKMAKLKINRKPYHRKSYVRKDGTRVKASDVKGSSFSVKDRGKPGRTPKSEQFYHPKVEMGWHKGQSATTRRRLALKAHGGDNLATARALQALANVTTDSTTARLARQDALYFYGKHKKK
jgi:hypothetical protein